MKINTRGIAADVIANVLDNGQSLTVTLENALPKLAQAKDQAFVQAVCFGVLRQFYRLDCILQQLLDKPIKDTKVKALVLVGLYQIIFMRVKAHAAVSETVQAAHKKAWAKSLVNALLRRYLRESQDIELKANQTKSAVTCHPEWLIKKISSDWPTQAEDIFTENNTQAPMSLRVNLKQISRNDYTQQLNAQGLFAEPVAFCSTALILEKPVPVEQLQGFAEGQVSVQDTAAQLAAELLLVEPDQRVLDVCAAPGGKAAHILEHYPQIKELVVLDIDAERMLRVDENFQRLALMATRIVGDATNPESWWDGRKFERILLDAPCSGLGVIRRHPDIKILRRSDDIEQLQVLQSAILNSMWPLLAPGGMLLYATCSILKQENEQQIQKFLEKNKDATELPIEAGWGRAVSVGRQILTGENAMDGFYYARLVKN